MIALVALLIAVFPDTLFDGDDSAELVRNLALLVLVGSSLVAHLWTEPGKVLKSAAIWLAIGGVVFLGYTLRHDAADLGARLKAELLPHAGRVQGDGLVIPASSNGHFMVTARVDGVDVRFLVDTGASDVVLSPADARRIGFDLGTLRFTRTYSTANGKVSGAPVRLGRVEMGPIVQEDVKASVNGAAMRNSLLGMSFLNRLGGYAVSRDQLTLRP